MLLTLYRYIVYVHHNTISFDFDKQPGFSFVAYKGQACSILPSAAISGMVNYKQELETGRPTNKIESCTSVNLHTCYGWSLDKQLSVTLSSLFYYLF